VTFRVSASASGITPLLWWWIEEGGGPGMACVIVAVVLMDSLDECCEICARLHRVRAGDDWWCVQK
jgi:hypothetical protein